MSAENLDGDRVPFQIIGGRMVAINLAVALFSSLLMIYLEHAFLAWPRDSHSVLMYWLIAPFLLVPPMWALAALGFGTSTALASADRPWRPSALVALAVALFLALTTGSAYFIALAAILGY